MIILIMSLLSSSPLFAQSKKPHQIVLQRESNGRPFYIDKDGDKIVIIDYKTRKDLQDLSKYQNSANARPTDTKSFYKESASNIKIIPSKKVEYETYTIEEGDSWESISVKLYGSNEKAVQLKLWNEELLKDVNLPAGTEMKYIEEQK